MADSIPSPLASGSGGSAPAEPVALTPASDTSGAPAAPVHAAKTVPLFGGNRGGKRRKDGLPPGSDAAREADRKRDAERKRRQREETARVAEPPALSPSPESLASDYLAQGGAPVPVLSGPVTGVAGPVPWSPELIEEFTGEIVEAVETFGVEKFADEARAARLSEGLVREIVVAAHFPRMPKESLKKVIPRIVTKWLNRFGVSAEFADEMIGLASLVTIALHQKRTWDHLRELIGVAKASAEAARKAESAVSEALSDKTTRLEPAGAAIPT